MYIFNLKILQDSFLGRFQGLAIRFAPKKCFQDLRAQRGGRGA